MRLGNLSMSRRVIAYALSVCGFLACSLFASLPAHAATGINSQINFQGRLLNSAGATVPDGFYNIEFKIYQDGDGQTVGDTTGSPAGTLKWTEDYLNNNSQGVVVKNGFLSVQLGSINPFGSNVNWNSDTLWLSMNIGGTGATCTPFASCTPDGEMIPMKRMSANAYSLNSGLLGGLTSSQFVQLAAGLQTDATTSTNSIYINKTGTGNLVDLQSGGVDSFVVSNAGDLTFGANGNHALAVATTATTAGKQLTISSGNAGTGTALAGGNLVLQAGTGGTTNGIGGNIAIDAGLHTGTGSDGTISIGTTTASAITLGKTGIVTTLNGRLAVGADYTAAVNVTATNATTKGVVTRGAASQTADLSQNQDSNGAVLSGTAANGSLYSNGTSNTFSGLAAPIISTASTGSAVYYAVTATNSTSESGYTATLGMASSTSTISWAQVPGATGYKIYRSATNAFANPGTYLVGTITNGTTVSFSDTGITATTGAPPAGNSSVLLRVATPSQTYATGSCSSDIFQVGVSGGTSFKVNCAGSNIFSGGVQVTTGGLQVTSSVGTVYSNLLSGSSTTASTLLLKGITSQSGDLLDLQDVSGNQNASFSALGNQLTLGRIAASGTVTQGKIVMGDGTADNFGLTLQPTTLTAAQIITLPNVTGTLAVTSDTTNFIRNQTSSQTGNFNITGTGSAATSVTTPSLDSTTTTLTLGAATATTINVGSVTLSSGTQTVNLGTNNTAGSTTNVVIGAGSTATGGTTTLQAKGNVTINSNGVARATFDTAFDLYLGNGITAASPNNFVVSGTGSTTTAVSGGALTIQGGNATVGNANGGNLTVSGGTGFGTGANGLVVLTTPTFSTATSDANCYTGGALVSVSCTITAASVNGSSAVIVGFTATGLTASLPNPGITTAGRVVYVTAAAGSSDFTLSVNGGGTGNTIAMRQNTTATMIWNGAAWTAAGASSSTTLQSAYDNTLQSAGGAELIVSHTSNTNGLTIRDSSVNPVNGTLLSVQTTSAAVLFSVTSSVTEYSTDGGAETAGGTSSTFPASTWSSSSSSTVSRYTTTGNYIATGQGSVSVATTTAANAGVKDALSTALTANNHYNVSFTTRLSSGTFTDMNVYYSVDGTSSSVACTTAQAVDTSVWTKVNCAFAAPASGITSSNAILIRQTGSGTARTFYVDNLSVTIAGDFNYATDGSVDDSTNFATNWTAVSGSTVSRSTTVGNDASDSAQVVTTAANQGVRNKLAINPLASTLYRVTAYVASTTSGFNSFTARYSRDGGTNFVGCADYNTQSISSITTSFTEVTCYITTDGTAPSNPYVYFTQTDATGRTFYVDTFSMTLTSNTTPDVQIGGGINGGPVTLLTLDRAASAPIASNNDALLGSMYYDTTLGKLQCYESDGWGACGSSPNNIVTISPEYTNAVMHGTGVGTMTSDLCSDTLNVNDGSSGQPTICGTNETYNFYKWTSPQASAQTYSIYVTYQLPSTFKTFASGQTSLMGRTDSSNATVQYGIYQNNSSTGLTQCGSTVAVSTGSVASWQTGIATGSADPSTCGFGPGDSIVFKIDVIASSNADAYVGNLNFTFSNK